LLANGVGLGEHLHDLLRRGVGGNVVVGWLAAKKDVADAAAGEVGLVAMLAEGAHDFCGVLLGVRHQRDFTQLD